MRTEPFTPPRPGFYRLQLNGGPFDGSLRFFEFLPTGKLPRCMVFRDPFNRELFHRYRYRHSNQTYAAYLIADFISPSEDFD